jgi:23S rRNA (uracil1939-C5)-methyltransferase
MTNVHYHIEKIGFQGDGITKDGLFIPLSLPGETLTALKGKDNHARIVDILSPSLERVSPLCRHFSQCGGCSLQHWDMGAYSRWKRDILISQLLRAGFDTEVAAILTTAPHSRRRVGLHAKQIKGTKGHPKAELGFKIRRSWEQVKIEECPVAHPDIIKALPQLTELAACLFEHPKSAPILNVTLSQTGLDIDIRGVERSKSGGLSADARMQVAMIAQGADFARVTLSEDILYQSRLPSVRFGRAQIDLPPAAFLQASLESEGHMVALVKQGLEGAKRVADLFCGAGTFTFPMSETAVVYAADGASSAIASLKSAVGRTPGLKTITAEARDLFRRPVIADEMAQFEAIVFDPPRAGAEAQVMEIVRSKVGRVMAVSCNPQTFVRDAKILTEGGFKLEQVTPIDQFLWSGHIELVAKFSR